MKAHSTLIQHQLLAPMSGVYQRASRLQFVEVFSPTQILVLSYDANAWVISVIEASEIDLKTGLTVFKRILSHQIPLAYDTRFMHVVDATVYVLNEQATLLHKLTLITDTFHISTHHIGHFEQCRIMNTCVFMDLLFIRYQSLDSSHVQYATLDPYTLEVAHLHLKPRNHIPLTDEIHLTYVGSQKLIGFCDDPGRGDSADVFEFDLDTGQITEISRRVVNWNKIFKRDKKYATYIGAYQFLISTSTVLAIYNVQHHTAMVLLEGSTDVVFDLRERGFANYRGATILNLRKPSMDRLCDSVIFCSFRTRSDIIEFSLEYLSNTKSQNTVFSRLYKSEKYTDGSIIVGEDCFKVHMAVFYCRAKYMYTQFTDNSLIVLQRFSKSTVEEALRYLYTNERRVDPTLELHEFCLYYQITGLLTEIHNRRKKRGLSCRTFLHSDRLMKGSRLCESNRGTLALAAYSHALNATTDNLETIVILQQRAKCYAKLNQKEKAIEDCERIIELDDSRVEGFLLKASITTDPRLKITLLERALKADPENTMAATALAECIPRVNSRSEQSVNLVQGINRLLHRSNCSSLLLVNNHNLSDASIQLTDGDVVHLHKCLASSLQFFEDLFQNSKEPEKPILQEVLFPNDLRIDADALATLLEFVYGGTEAQLETLSVSRIVDVLNVAIFVNFPEVIDICDYKLQSMISPKTIGEIFQAASQKNTPELYMKCVSFMLTQENMKKYGTKAILGPRYEEIEMLIPTMKKFAHDKLEILGLNAYNLHTCDYSYRDEICNTVHMCPHSQFIQGSVVCPRLLHLRYGFTMDIDFKISDSWLHNTTTGVHCDMLLLINEATSASVANNISNFFDDTNPSTFFSLRLRSGVPLIHGYTLKLCGKNIQQRQSFGDFLNERSAIETRLEDNKPISLHISLQRTKSELVVAVKTELVRLPILRVTDKRCLDAVSKQLALKKSYWTGLRVFNQGSFSRFELLSWHFSVLEIEQ